MLRHITHGRWLTTGWAITKLPSATAIRPSSSTPTWPEPGAIGATPTVTWTTTTQAIEDCTRAIEIKPDYPEAYNIRGVAYEATDDRDQPSRTTTGSSN